MQKSRGKRGERGPKTQVHGRTKTRSEMKTRRRRRSGRNDETENQTPYVISEKKRERERKRERKGGSAIHFQRIKTIAETHEQASEP
jgi:hypothetical protein